MGCEKLPAKDVRAKSVVLSDGRAMQKREEQSRAHRLHIAQTVALERLVR